MTTYLQKYTSISAQAIATPSLARLPEVGYHALFSDRDRAYLTSCISPRSPSNVTQRQFSRHRYQNDLQWQVALDWLQGKASIRDRRCFWILLSTPLTQADSSEDYRALETVWQDVYRWGTANFPPLKE